MTDRENQQRLDQLALKYLEAIDAEDFDTMGALWQQAEDDPDLDAMLHGLNAELVAEQNARDNAAASVILDAVEKTMPSAEVIRPEVGPLTVADVADYLRRNPPAGLTIEELKLNDVLLAVTRVMPTETGISEVVAWGAQFGTAPEAYWKAFRKAALKLRMQRESETSYQMAARQTKRKPPGGKP